MKDIFESHPVSVLKKEISKTNIKGYSKLKKAAIIELMMKNKDRFSHIKMADKKERKKPVKVKEEKKADKVKVKEEKKADKVKVKPEKKQEKKPEKKQEKKTVKKIRTETFKSFTDKLYANQAKKEARQKKKNDAVFERIFGSKN